MTQPMNPTVKTALEVLASPIPNPACPHFGGWIGTMDRGDAGLCTAMPMVVLVRADKASAVCATNAGCAYKTCAAARERERRRLEP